jgi:hypothetical protein
MSLPTSLLHNLKYSQKTWLPPKEPEALYKVYKFLEEEEVDEFDENGKKYRKSHFEFLIDACDELNVNTSLINRFIGNMERGKPFTYALSKAKLEAKLKGIPVNDRIF